jgi:hypothetical protein
MIPRRFWSTTLLVVALPAFAVAQDAPSPNQNMPASCPMMQGSGGMMTSGGTETGMIQPGTMHAAMMQPGMLQPAMMQRGRGTQMPQAAGYDKASEVTLTGTIAEMIQPPDTGGLHFAFKTADETIEVHLGPKSWLDSQGYTFAKGDELTIIGSRTTVHDMATMTNKVALIAREIKKGDKTMTLRDENGRPLWSGGMRNR